MKQEKTPWENAFDAVIEAIETGSISERHCKRLEAALARPKGRPKNKIGLNQYHQRVEVVLTMCRLMHDGLSYESAAYKAAQSHGIGAWENPSSETVKGWYKRDGRRDSAKAKIRQESGVFVTGDMMKSQHGYIRALLTEADQHGIEYAPDWPVSRVKKAIQSAKDKN